MTRENTTLTGTGSARSKPPDYSELFTRTESGALVLRPHIFSVQAPTPPGGRSRPVSSRPSMPSVFEEPTEGPDDSAAVSSSSQLQTPRDSQTGQVTQDEYDEYQRQYALWLEQQRQYDLYMHQYQQWLQQAEQLGYVPTLPGAADSNEQEEAVAAFHAQYQQWLAAQGSRSDDHSTVAVPRIEVNDTLRVSQAAIDGPQRTAHRTAHRTARLERSDSAASRTSEPTIILSD